MTALGAAVLLVALATMAHAQPAASLKEARALLAAGKPTEALEALADAKTADALSLKTEAAARARKFDVALAAYQSLRLASNGDSPALLRVMSQEYLSEAVKTADPLTVIEICAVNARQASPTPAPCLPAVRITAADTTQPASMRAAAAAVLTSTGDPLGPQTLKALAKGSTGFERRAVIAVHALLPRSTAVDLLVSALDDPDPGIQYTAAGALGDYSTAAARAALKRYVEAPERRSAKGAARLSLALIGDAESLAILRKELDQLGGGDLYAAALALQKQGDPAAVPALAKVAQGDHDLLRLEAGARLCDTRTTLARAVLDKAMDDPNPLTRTAALRAYASTAMLTVPYLLRGLGDLDPNVGRQAATILLERYPSSPRATASTASTKKPRPRAPKK